MPRLLGVDIPNDKPTWISLTYLYGVGPKTARELCHKAGVDTQRHARDLAEDELSRLAALLERDYTVEGPLRRQIAAEHQPAPRYQVLPGHPAPVGAAGPRTADADQRPHAEGTEEDRGREEGREGPAVAAGGAAGWPAQFGTGGRRGLVQAVLLSRCWGRHRRQSREWQVTKIVQWGLSGCGQEQETQNPAECYAGHRARPRDVQQHDRHHHRHQR